MVNGLGVLGWGVGGIEAEAAMLGQPIPMLLPEVIGFRLDGQLAKTSTATDLVLTIVEKLRQANVVGKFVEFYGDALDTLSIYDRCTIANMAPEYGATCGFFPVDQLTLDYLKTTGKSVEHVDMVENYCKEVGLFRDPNNDIKFSQELHLNLSDVLPCISGPKRPEDKILLSDVKNVISTEISKISKNKDSKKTVLEDGSIVIAAITSCTNTSNPSVIIGAGLLAKNAIEKGLNKKTWVKTSLAPGSKVVENYLRKADLLKYFNKLGFNIIGYGCTTCIGNSGPIDEKYVKEINDNDIVASSVLSGNRNFEGRIHPEVKMNFLMSPMLVIAYSLIGNINFDITRESLGKDKNNNDVFLSDIWPSSDDINSVIQKNIDSNMFVNSYKDLFEGDDNWKNISTSQYEFYIWEDSSTYIQRSPFFTNQNSSEKKLKGFNSNDFRLDDLKAKKHDDIKIKKKDRISNKGKLN